MRLPYAWNRRRQARPAKAPVQVVLTVEALGQAHEQKDADVTLDWDGRWRFDEELPIEPGVGDGGAGTGDRLSRREHGGRCRRGFAGRQGRRPGERPHRGDRFRQFKKDDAGKWDVWDKMKSQRTKPDGSTEDGYDQWAYYFRTMCRRLTYPAWRCACGAGGALAPTEFEMEPAEDRTWPLADRGLALLPDLKLEKADNVVEAMGMGMHRTWSSLRQICQGLVNMVTGRISVTKNLQGPLDIAEMTFEAAHDPFNLILMLGIISINLAVMNFLPIPVLDGGHMVFLIYELVRRQAAVGRGAGRCHLHWTGLPGPADVIRVLPDVCPLGLVRRPMT